MTVELEDAIILAAREKKLSSLQPMVPLREQGIQVSQKPLLIISGRC